MLEQKFTILQDVFPISLIVDDVDSDTQAAVDKLVRGMLCFGQSMPVCSANLTLLIFVLFNINKVYTFIMDKKKIFFFETMTLRQDGQNHLPLGGNVILRQSK